MDELKLFDAEFKFMCIVWECAPINSTALTRICEKQLGWKKPTTYSMIKKLSDRGIVKNENATVTALIKRTQVQRFESEALLEKAFDGSLPKFLTAFLQGKTISRSEAEELKKMIEEATK